MKLAANAILRIINNFNYGLIGVDADARITVYNRKAREITGVDFDRSNTHEAGALSDGDIVIIADTAVGGDDGDLCAEDLELLNISDKGIQPGCTLLCAGVYRNKKMDPVYKYVPDHQIHHSLTLETDYLGFHIRAMVDPIEKKVSIAVDGREFSMDYFNAMGHMVVIDGKNGHIKFFQMKGYTIRKEAVAAVLRGGSFLAKTASATGGLSVLGAPLSTVMEAGELTEQIRHVLSGEADFVEDNIYEINRRPFICSLFPLKRHHAGDVDGVFLLIQDATKMEALIDNRNRILEQKYNSSELPLGKDVNPNAFRNFVGSSQPMREVKYLACKASQTKFNVIITGENGTGKSQLAREIHRLGNEDAPFVEVNCSAIAPTLFESELFGYVSGAFTGASTGGKTGYFEAADGGTVFLDEIGEIPLDIQVKLLHVLQDKTIYRVGSSKPTKVNVRVIAATNSDLKEQVARGTFRQDLYYRINVFPIRIPPLRERKGDLYPLINQIMQKVCRDYGVEPKQFSGEALRKIMSYDWPGNVRELENVVERAITLCDTSLIYSEHIDISVKPARNNTLRELLTVEEERIIRASLARSGGDRRKAMEELGLSRSVFYEKCKKYGLL